MNVKKHLLGLTLMGMLVGQVVYAEVYNKIDKSYSSGDIEKGLHFYQEKKDDEKIVRNSDSKEDLKIPKVKSDNKTEELLSAIVILLQQQSKELENIKRNINPNEPRTIINQKGEECISNSSVDCFDIPVIQEARNVPVLEDFIRKPSEENAKEWLKYQAKLFNHYIDMGYALKFASLNGDEETYPVNALNIYGLSKNNMTAQLYKDRIFEILDEKKDTLGTMIFLGKSKNIEEQWGATSIGMLAFKKGKFFNIALVFDSEETKKSYDDALSAHHDMQIVEAYESLPKVVSNELFKKHNIKITPTAMAVYKDKEREFASVIERGFLTQANLIHNYQNFLVYNKIVEQKEFHSAKIWNTDIEERLKDDKE